MIVCMKLCDSLQSVILFLHYFVYLFLNQWQSYKVNCVFLQTQLTLSNWKEKELMKTSAMQPVRLVMIAKIINIYLLNWHQIKLYCFCKPWFINDLLAIGTEKTFFLSKQKYGKDNLKMNCTVNNKRWHIATNIVFHCLSLYCNQYYCCHYYYTLYNKNNEKIL